MEQSKMGAKMVIQRGHGDFGPYADVTRWVKGVTPEDLKAHLLRNNIKATIDNGVVYTSKGKSK